MIRQAAIRRGNPRTQIALTRSIPAPIKGWNTRDLLSSMKEEYAVILDNFLPSATKVSLRKGYIDWATGITGQVMSLMTLNSVSGKALFAANSSSIYDITAQGIVGAAEVTGLNNGYWQWINSTNDNGDTFLYAVNGVDKPLIYDGATWQAVDGVSAPIAITGVTTTNLIHINKHKDRIWFVEKSTMNAWYLDSGLLGGAANKFNLGPIFKKGGYLMAMATWTLDAGEGSDDHAVFVTSEGEVAIYRGTDPASVLTWALVGVFELAPPIGRRCCAKYGGDLLIICRDGLQPLSKALVSTARNSKTALTDNIQPSMTNAANLYSLNLGWGVSFYPAQNMLILNIPIASGRQEQYVMNTLTGAWCRFTGWGANVFEIFNDNLYYAGNGFVARAWEGFSDAGRFIKGLGLPAFSDFGKSSNKKQWTLARPVIITDVISIQLSLRVDYDTDPPISTPTFSTTSYGVWDSSSWDEDIWGGDAQIKKDWQTVTGLGYAASLFIGVNTKSASCDWVSTDYAFTVGGVL